MPIYQGLSTKNKAEIIINSQPMQKVYVGDRLVWQKSGETPIFYPEYGLLYNWYVGRDTRNLANSGWKVPTYTDYVTLRDYLGGANVAGGKLKETGFTYWLEPNEGATNEVGFNARAGGHRTPSFQQRKLFISLWTNNDLGGDIQYSPVIWYTNANFTLGAAAKRSSGRSMRLLKTSTSLSHGQTGTYMGNDSRVYRTICIGTQEWLADNLSETRFRDGSVIPWYWANPANYFTNAEWDELTTAGMCAYNNDVNNVASGFTFPT